MKTFRQIRAFKPALEIAQWMTEMKYLDSTPSNIAIQLALISKVHDLDRAEKCFNSLENSLLALPVYGAILNCYAEAQSLEKAEAVVEKIKRLDSCNTLAYSAMLKLYFQAGKREKLDFLAQEMEDKGVTFDECTYNILLNAYATSCDIEEMEKLVRKMEIDPLITLNIITYVTTAKGYVKAVKPEKALVVLKKAEHLIKRKEKGERLLAYGVLITVYATMQKTEEVYRLWDLVKENGKLHNRNYISMISSLEKLDDLEGAEKVLEEWEEKAIYFDIRIPNLVIYAYCKKGRVTEAELILNKMVETGKEPNASTWSRMAFGYCKVGLMEKTVDKMKRAFCSSSPRWTPDIPVVAACFEYLKKKGDEDGMREILVVLEKSGKFSVGFKEVIQKYVRGGKLSW